MSVACGSELQGEADSVEAFASFIRRARSLHCWKTCLSGECSTFCLVHRPVQECDIGSNSGMSEATTRPPDGAWTEQVAGLQDAAGRCARTLCIIYLISILPVSFLLTFFLSALELM